MEHVHVMNKVAKTRMVTVFVVRKVYQIVVVVHVTTLSMLVHVLIVAPMG